MLPNACHKPKSKPKVRVSLKHGKRLKRTRRPLNDFGPAMRDPEIQKRVAMKQVKPMKKFNAKRKGHAFPRNVDEAYREWIRSLPCILSGKMNAHGQHRCWSVVQVCHVKTRGSGGQDRNNCFPGCVAAHDQQHIIGIREFEQRWDVSLKTIARQLTAIYEAEHFPCP